jgi:hypothetical protein
MVLEVSADGIATVAEHLPAPAGAVVFAGVATNTPGDQIGLAGLTVTLMEDGFYLVPRSLAGGRSAVLASGRRSSLPVVPP